MKAYCMLLCCLVGWQSRYSTSIHYASLPVCDSNCNLHVMICNVHVIAKPFGYITLGLILNNSWLDLEQQLA